MRKFLHNHRNFFEQLFSTLSLRPRARNHPGMLTLDERIALYVLARDYYTGSGIIVDAGIFLGCSTACFAEGLRQRGITTGKPIKSYDIAICEPPMGAQVPDLYRQGFLEKKRYRDIGRLGNHQGWQKASKAVLRAHIEDYTPLVDLENRRYPGNPDGPGAADRNPVSRRFAKARRSMIMWRAQHFPVSSRVIRSSCSRIFFTKCLPFIHLTMGHLKDYFTYLVR